MADNLTITSTYAGELALPYIDAAIMSGDTLAKKYITIKENVKYKLVIKKLASSGLIKAAACDFDNATSALTLTEAILTTTNLMTNLQFCKAEFLSDWEAMSTGRGSLNSEMPKNFTDFMLAHVAAKVGEAMEFNLWQGNFDPLDAGGAPTYTDFNGLLKVMDDANGNAPDVELAVLTANNVIAALQSVTNAIPAPLMGSPSVKLYMNRKTAHLYRQAVTNTSNGFVGNAAYAGAIDIFDGYEIYVCPGINDNCIVAAEPDNLYFGTDLLSDQNEATVVDTSLTLADNNVRVAMRYSGGVQIGFIADIVLAYDSTGA